MCSIKSCVVIVVMVLILALIVNLAIFIQPKTFDFSPDCSDPKVCVVNVTSDFRFSDKVILIETKQSWNCIAVKLSFDPVLEPCLDAVIDVTNGAIWQKTGISPNCSMSGSHLVRSLCSSAIHGQSTKEIEFRVVKS